MDGNDNLKMGIFGPEVGIEIWMRQGECRRCGDCCRVINLPKRIEAYKRWGLPATELPGNQCQHFQDGNPSACLAYTDRPLYCKVFPRHPADIEALPNCGYSFVKMEGEESSEPTGKQGTA